VIIARGQTKRCFPLSRRGGDRLYHAVNAHVVKEKQTGREVSKGGGRRKTRRETSARAVRNRGGEDA